MNYELAKERNTKGQFVSGHGSTNTAKGIAKESGANHYLWKGEAASYFAKHDYIRRHFGSAVKCENPEGCVYPRKNAARSWVRIPKRFEWALIKGRTYSHNRENYMQLCASCHRKYDAD